MTTLTPRPPSTRSHDKEPVNARKRSPEWRARQAQALKTRWANMTPEERQAETDRKHATERARRQKRIGPTLGKNFVPTWIDEDFDEMEGD